MATVPDDKDLQLVNDMLAGCDAEAALRLGHASAVAWMNGYHVTRRLLEGARDCRNMREAADYAQRWLERRNAKAWP